MRLLSVARILAGGNNMAPPRMYATAARASTSFAVPSVTWPSESASLGTAIGTSLSLPLSTSPHHSNKNMAMLCNIYPCASKSTICLDSNAILSSACSVSFFPFFLYTTLQTPFFELVSFACYRLLIADVRDTLMGSPHSKTCVWQDLHPYLQSWQLQRRKC